MTTPFATAGIVLAAGASTRMGYPKSLLPLPDGTLLAAHQMRVLRAAGCARVAVVLGSRADAIADKITDGEVIKNPAWASGRLTSIQAGLRALPGYDGYVLLPVDTVGVTTATLADMLHAATHNRPAALRPFYQQQPGRVLWISAATAQEIMAQPAEDARLDEYLADRVQAVPVDDPAVLNNVNTPDEWSALRTTIS